jgi:hypothetical protein
MSEANDLTAQQLAPKPRRISSLAVSKANGLMTTE